MRPEKPSQFRLPSESLAHLTKSRDILVEARAIVERCPPGQTCSTSAVWIAGGESPISKALNLLTAALPRPWTSIVAHHDHFIRRDKAQVLAVFNKAIERLDRA